MSNNDENKKKNEQFYFSMINDYFGEKVEGFNASECPDFHNNQYNLGVEMVKATTQGRRYAYYHKALDFETKEEAEKLSDNCFKSDYKDELVYFNDKPYEYGYAEIQDGTDYANLICKLIEEKLKKLNSTNYKKFKTNILLIIICEAGVDKHYIETYILEKIRSLENSKTIKFDEYLMLRPIVPSKLHVIKNDNTVEEMIFKIS